MNGERREMRQWILDAIAEGVELAAQVREAYTVEELADRWGVSPNTVRKEIREGRLETFRIGEKCIRVSRKAVLDYMRLFGTPANRIANARLQNRAEY